MSTFSISSSSVPGTRRDVAAAAPLPRGLVPASWANAMVREFVRTGRGARPLLIAAMLVTAVAPGLVQAGQGFRGAHRDDPPREGPRDERGYVLDNRSNHNHYYPPRGYGVPALPRGYSTLHYRGGPYYYHQVVYYRPGPRFFVVFRPSLRLFVPVLPPFYTTIYFGGIPYYYADDTYYLWRPDRRAYVVTEPPAGASENTATSKPAGSSDELFI